MDPISRGPASGNEEVGGWPMTEWRRRRRQQDVGDAADGGDDEDNQFEWRERSGFCF